MNAEDLKKIVGEYAHVYAFVADDTMPRKHREMNAAIDAVFEGIECLQIQLDFLQGIQEKNALLTAKLSEAEHQRNDLLALIHRDGGHHVDTFGVDQSMADAERVLWLWRDAYEAAIYAASAEIAKAGSPAKVQL